MPYSDPLSRRLPGMSARFRRWLIGAALLCLLAVPGWLLYDLGRVHGVVGFAALRSENQVLKRRNGKLEDEVEALRARMAVLERSSQIDQQAAQAVKSDLGQLAEDLQAAREEVEFYRGIVAPGDVNPGLRIHRFLLDPGLAAGEYRYELVLTQLKHNDRAVSGVVDWRIVGSREGVPDELDLAAVAGADVPHLRFRFRYFQELTGTLNLPSGFKADHVELTVRPEGKQHPVEQQFDWPDTDG